MNKISNMYEDPQRKEPEVPQGETETETPKSVDPFDEFPDEPHSIDAVSGEDNDSDVIIDITPSDKKVRHRSFRRRLHSFFSIRDDVASHEKIKERIVSGGKVTGTNASILIFAILIACVGLITDSIPVVIGAMLISPLMGSLMAISYGAISADVRFTRDAIFGFSFQFLVSLGVATIFFLICPVKEATEELMKRTAPNLFDILIALCGGAAGMIAQTRSSKYSNVVPGVAIATALMPPVCTMGYSLANGQWEMLAGSAVLFTINVYCIFAAGAIVLGFLQVPRVTPLQDKKWKALRFIMVRNGILIGAPAILLVVLVSLGII